MKKFVKVEFDIMRADFNDPVTLEMVQKCFTIAQMSCVTPVSKILFKKNILKPKNQIKLFVYVFISALFYNYFIGINLYLCVFIITFLYLFVFFFIIRENLRKKWKEYVDQVKSEKDLNSNKANKIYSKEKNLFLIAKTRKNEIIGTAALMIGDEKHIYRENFGQAFDENDSLLLRVAVLPKYHGSGIGKALYQACYEFAKDHNCKSINLFVVSIELAAKFRSRKFREIASSDLVPAYGFKAFQMKIDI